MKAEEAIKKCICKSCPSFKDCKEKIAYCFNRKSKCIKEDRGCICGGCPVYRQENLNHYDFCRLGSDKQIS